MPRGSHIDKGWGALVCILVSSCSVGIAQVTGIESDKASNEAERPGDSLSVRSAAIDVTYTDTYGPVDVHAATGIACRQFPTDGRGTPVRNHLARSG